MISIYKYFFDIKTLHHDSRTLILHPFPVPERVIADVQTP